MKKLILNMLAFVLMSLGVTSVALADKIIIKGKPTPVFLESDVYVVHGTPLVTNSGYYYVTMDEKERVCYEEKVPTLVDLQVFPFKMKLGGDAKQVYCYDVNPTYFVIE